MVRDQNTVIIPTTEERSLHRPQVGVVKSDPIVSHNGATETPIASYDAISSSITPTEVTLSTIKASSVPIFKL